MIILLFLLSNIFPEAYSRIDINFNDKKPTENITVEKYDDGSIKKKTTIQQNGTIVTITCPKGGGRCSQKIDSSKKKQGTSSFYYSTNVESLDGSFVGGCSEVNSFNCPTFINNFREKEKIMLAGDGSKGSAHLLQCGENQPVVYDYFYNQTELNQEVQDYHSNKTCKDILNEVKDKISLLNKKQGLFFKLYLNSINFKSPTENKKTTISDKIIYNWNPKDSLSLIEDYSVPIFDYSNECKKSNGQPNLTQAVERNVRGSGKVNDYKIIVDFNINKKFLPRIMNEEPIQCATLFVHEFLRSFFKDSKKLYGLSSKMISPEWLNSETNRKDIYCSNPLKDSDPSKDIAFSKLDKLHDFFSNGCAQIFPEEDCEELEN